MDVREIARWAIRVSIGCYVLNVTSRIWRRDPVPSGSELTLWVVGCIAYLAHIGLAFHAFHQWSHQAAVEFTADETRRLTGIRNGEGVWANYVFAFVWIGDCFRLARIRRPDRAPHGGSGVVTLGAVIDCFFALMMFSATVVFGPTVYRVFFVPLIIFWLWLLVRRK